MLSDLTIRVQSQDQGWQVLGVDRHRGITPEGLSAVANSWGPDTCNFILKRRPGAIFPDLQSFTPCEIESGGVVVWDGRIREAPEQSDSHQVSVTGAGWQYHLDDDTYEKVWVHTRLSDWRDMRSFVAADLTKARAQFQVATDRGSMVIAYPAGNQLTNGDGSLVGVVLDLGPGCTGKRIVVTYDSSASTAGSSFEAWASDTPNALVGTTSQAFTSTIAALTASGTISGTFATANRYITLWIKNATSGTPADPGISVKIKSAQVFNQTAYESGNASILKTSDLVKDALTHATLLSQDTSLIPTTTFTWPEFAPFTERTAREIIEAANVAEGRQARLIPGTQQLEYRALPTVPIFVLGEWPGSIFSDTSAGSGQDVYNKAKITGAQPDGTRVTVTRTQTGTIADKFAFTKTMVLPVSMGLNSALGNQLGDAFLSVHKTTPLKGDASVVYGGARWYSAGGNVRPALFLRNTGELLHLSNRVDPDTGAWGRDGRIAQVTWEADTDTAHVSLDNARDQFGTLLGRLDAILAPFQ